MKKNYELPNAVKKALVNHYAEGDQQLSKRDVENAWIVFTNTLAAEKNVENVSAFRRVFKRVPSFYWSFPALAGALAVAIVVFNRQDLLDNSPSLMVSQNQQTSEINSENMAKHLLNSREYELPRPERFSELVSFVKSDMPLQGSRPHYEELNQRLFSEIEGSLRDPVYVKTNSPQLIFVANE